MSKQCALPKRAFPLKFKVKSPSHALELARQLIKPFIHWTVGKLASTGVEDEAPEIKVKSARAKAFCALGALQRVNTRHSKAATIFLSKAAALCNDSDVEFATTQEIFQVNDEARDRETHRNVLKMFTKAIRLARKAEANG